MFVEGCPLKERGRGWMKRAKKHAKRTLLLVRLLGKETQELAVRRGARTLGLYKKAGGIGCFPRKFPRCSTTTTSISTLNFFGDFERRSIPTATIAQEHFSFVVHDHLLGFRGGSQ